MGHPLPMISSHPWLHSEGSRFLCLLWLADDIDDISKTQIHLEVFDTITRLKVDWCSQSRSIITGQLLWRKLFVGASVEVQQRHYWHIVKKKTSQVSWKSYWDSQTKFKLFGELKCFDDLKIKAWWSCPDKQNTALKMTAVGKNKDIWKGIFFF